MNNSILSVIDDRIRYSTQRMEEADRNDDAAGTATWRNRLDALLDVRQKILEAISDVV